TYTRQRDSSAELTSNDGFSVVAPTRTTVPFSTCGRNASCWARLNRWISSTKRIVRMPRRVPSRSASPITSRISLTPDSTAENATKRAPVTLASRDASVVLPEPGGPHRIIECSSPVSIAPRSTRPGPSRCSCPTISSIDCGRMRSASGAAGRRVAPPRSASLNSSTSGPPGAPRGQPGGQERQVVEVHDRRDLPAFEIFGPGAIGDERHARLGGGDTVDPGVADDDRVARVADAVPQLAEVVGDHSPSIGVGLERAHVVARDDEVELVHQTQAREGGHGELARVVGPDRSREPAAPGAGDGGERTRLERGDLHRAPLVIERDLPEVG